MNTLRKLFYLIIRYPFVCIFTVILVIASVFLVCAGHKIQIGGILSRLWNRTKENDPSIIVIPHGRIDDKNEQIIPGQSDENGFVQVMQEVNIKPSTIFSDPNEITVLHSDGEKVVLPLPKGITNGDVQKIILISPSVYQIVNKDSGVDLEALSKMLSK